MNIQIFGTKNNNDSKKAERYFKERNIKVQYIDMNRKGLSRGELTSVIQAVGGVDNIIDPDAKDKQTLNLIKYLGSGKEEKVFENQDIIKLPVVRNGKQATVGYCPDTWKDWE